MTVLSWVYAVIVEMVMFVLPPQISPATLDAFLVQVEKGYKCHQNSYHNETHGADVLQTVHTLVVSAQLDQVWYSSVSLAVFVSELDGRSYLSCYLCLSLPHM